MRFLFSILFFAWFAASWAREEEVKNKPSAPAGPRALLQWITDAWTALRRRVLRILAALRRCLGPRPRSRAEAVEPSTVPSESIPHP